MVTVDQAIIAKIEIKGKKFEILVDPEIAYSLKEGKTVSISRMMAVSQIFTDAKKGTKAPESDILKVFGTSDTEKIAEHIIKKGDIQLTTELRRRKTEERKKQVASIISRNAINPQTKMPHPQERILTSIEQARFNVDPFKTADQQVDDALKAIKSIIPISMEETMLLVEVPAQHSSRCLSVLREHKVLQERWLSDGSLSIKLMIPAGLKESIFRQINNATRGEAKIQETRD